jgi:hypothetical protein
MCPNKDIPKEEIGFMSFDLYCKVIDEACAFVHDVNLHHRGESTLHPRLIDMIRYADQKGVKVKLHTNATTLTETVSRELIKSGLRLISFSFDGFDGNTYEKVRSGAKYQQTLENIHRFLEIKNDLLQQEPRTVLEVMEFEEREADHIKDRFIKSLKTRGLNRLIIKKPHNWAGNVDLTTYEKLSFSPCTFPWHALVILWDGRVGACPHDFFAKIIYGDMSGSNLTNLFNSPEIQSLRETMVKDFPNGLKPPCNTCDSVHRKRFAGIPLASMKYLRD